MENDAYRQIIKIQEITRHILGTYNMLRQMEKDGRKESSNYHELVMFLAASLEIEKSLYQFFVRKKNVTKETIDMLINVVNKNYIDYPAINILYPKTDGLINNRIISRLKTIYYANPDVFLTTLTKEDMICIADEDNFEGINYLYELCPILAASTNIRVAGFIEDAIKVEQKPKVKDNLIDAKYYLSFLSDDLEKTYLRNNFDQVPNTFSQDVDVPYQLFDVGWETNQKVKNSYGLSVARTAARLLMSYHDYEYQEIDTRTKITILIGLLRTGFLYLDRNTASDLYDELMRKINDPAQQRLFPKQQGLRRIIEIAFATNEQTLHRVNQGTNVPPKYS